MAAGSELATALTGLMDVLVTSVRGMAVTAAYLFRPAEIITQQYPRERSVVPPTARGRLVNDVERCIVCELCAKACPTRCIDMTWEIGPDKKRILHTFDIDMTICLYCGLCTDACPDSTNDADGIHCLTMDGGYEYSSAKKEEIGFYFRASENELAVRRAASAENARQRAEKSAKPAGDGGNSSS